MKYCSKCGKELMDEAVICVGCGCPVSGAPAPAASEVAKQETSGLATSAIVCAILLPLVGLILGIVGCCKYKDPQLKKKSQRAIIASIACWLIYFSIFSMMAQM